jgi:hypothetical protein
LALQSSGASSAELAPADLAAGANAGAAVVVAVDVALEEDSAAAILLRSTDTT